MNEVFFDEDLETIKFKIAALEEELERTKKEAAEYLDLLRRVKADFENYRKRVLKEQTELLKYSKKDLIAKLLPVIDNFERALQIKDPTKEPKALFEGVKLIYKQLMEILQKEGVESFGKVGENFDPFYHEAFSKEETSEEPEGKILHVFQKGYKLHDKVIRPALVKVAVKPNKQE